jgi:ABC-type sugar transport system ATPase subunit
MAGSSIHEFCKNQMRLLMEVYFHSEKNSPKVKQPSLAAKDGNIVGITGLEVNSS